MKIFKRTICLLLIGAIFTFAACGKSSGSDSSSNGQNGGSTTKGRYIESQLNPDPDADVPYFYLGKDGKLGAYNADFTTHYESEDSGKTWQKSEGPGKKNPDMAGKDNYAFSEDGDVYTESYSSSMSPSGASSSEKGIQKYTKDGNKETLTVPELDEAIANGEQPYLDALKCLPGNRLLVSWVSMSGTASTSSGESVSDENETPTTSEGDASEVTNDTTASSGSDSESTESMETNQGAQTADGFTTGALLYDSEAGKSVADLEDGNFSLSTYDQENLYYIDTAGNIKAVTLADGSDVKIKELSINTDSLTINRYLFKDSQDFFLADAKGVKKITADGSETILDGSSYAFGNSGAQITGFYSLKDNSFLTTVKEDNKTTFYKYDWDPNAILDASKTLKAWTLRDSAFVRSTISQFRKKNPDIMVSLETALEENSSQTPEDAIRSLNTRMLAGDGPDILFLDDCPIESYIKQGLLLDLTKSIDTSGLYSSLVDSFKTDKGLFTLPGRFQMPLLTGSQKLLDDVKTLTDFVDKVKSGNPPLTSGPNENGDTTDLPFTSFDQLDEWFNILWNSSASAFFKDNKLDSDQLKEFLTALKNVSDYYNLTEPSDGPNNLMAIMSDSSSDAIKVAGSVTNFSMGQALSSAYMVENLISLITFGGLSSTDDNQPKDDIQSKPFAGLQEGSWVPYGLVSINAQTKVKELAEKFVSEIFSPEAQAIRINGGLPISKDGLAKQLESMKDLDDKSDSGIDIDFDALISKLTTPVMVDNTLKETVSKTATEYCKDEISLEEALAKIEQDSKNYLAERQ